MRFMKDTEFSYQRVMLELVKVSKTKMTHKNKIAGFTVVNETVRQTLE